MTQPAPLPQPAARSRNPVLVGCLVIVAVVLLGGGFAAYWFIGRPALAAINAARDLGRIQELDNRVSNRQAFTPPTNGELTPQQLQRYLAVGDAVTSRLRGRLDVLEQRYEDLDSDNVTFANLRQAASAWADLLKLVVEAKGAQVDALNANGFSLAEYAWVRQTVLTAAGLDFFQVDMQSLIDGGDPTLSRQDRQAVKANVDLVAPYRDRLEELVPMAVFGL